MRDKIIYHFVKESWWLRQQKEELYFSEHFQTENFIHASTASQLLATVNRYYKSEQVVFLLHIDSSLLLAILKYEMSQSIQEEFPHIFGGINRDAVVKVQRLTKFNNEVWQL